MPILHFVPACEVKSSIELQFSALGAIRIALIPASTQPIELDDSLFDTFEFDKYSAAHPETWKQNIFLQTAQHLNKNGQQNWHLYQEENAFHFYFWHPYLLQNFTNEKVDDVEKIKNAQTFLNIDENREKIWQEAIISFLQVFLPVSFLPHISLTNPPRVCTIQCFGFEVSTVYQCPTTHYTYAPDSPLSTEKFIEKWKAGETRTWSRNYIRDHNKNWLELKKDGIQLMLQYLLQQPAAAGSIPLIEQTAHEKLINASLPQPMIKKIPVTGIDKYYFNYTDHLELGITFTNWKSALAFYQEFKEKFVNTNLYKPLGSLVYLVKDGSSYIVRCEHWLDEKIVYRSDFDNDKKVRHLKGQFPIWLAYFDIPGLAEKLEALPDDLTTPCFHPINSERPKLTYSFKDEQFAPLETYTSNGEWKRLGNTAVFYADGYPWNDVAWPRARDYIEYGTLLEVQDEESIYDKLHVKFQDYLQKAKPDKFKIIEFGPGIGNVLRYTREKFPVAEIIGVGVTPVKEENADACNELYYAPIPSNLAVLEKHINTVDQIVDVFGACTYSNPVHSLIYAAFLLKKGGNFNSIVSGLLHSFEVSPLGDGFTRAKLVAFFKKYLNIDLVIAKTKVISQVEATKDQVVEDLCVSFTKNAFSFEPTVENFKEMCRLADQFIGQAYKVQFQGDVFGKFSKKLSIDSNIYKKTKGVFFEETRPERQQFSEDMLNQFQRCRY